ncbi:MAG: sensor histidine kinase [Candidatus Rifleibacteriota bacterium]
MPETLLDALTHEAEGFKQSLASIQQNIKKLTQSANTPTQIRAKLDDLENIILAASESMPGHVAGKARQAFDDLRSSVETPPDSDGSAEILQLVLRLQSQANMIIKRVESILKAYNSTENTANGIIMAQEEERRRISREIHDGPAQTLASLTMKIDYCMDQPDLSGHLIDELKELKLSVKRSLQDIRRFIFDLRPMALDDLGLIPTLEQFISGFKKRTGIPVYVNIEGDRVPMNQDTELAVFRVIQEAANNSIKHADPTSVHIFVKYSQQNQKLSVVLKDDGAGFDLETVKKNYGTLKKLGLKSMEERIRLAGGEFEIVSGLNEGTVVSFWVPFN